MNRGRCVIAIPALSIFVVLAVQGIAWAVNSGVLASPHNLSVGGGTGKHGLAFDEVRVCVFCHTPHNALSEASSLAPLWNRNLPSDAQQYSMYDSATFSQLVNPLPTKPTGASRICLGCHDGTIALNRYGGAVISGGAGISTPTFMPSDTNPANNSNLTTNLSSDHPISFPYTAALAAQAQLVAPTALPVAVKLDNSGNLQCTACHDPHNDVNGNFLVIDNSPAGSPLCTGCHTPAGWDASSPHYAGNGCMNCHTVHNSPVAQYLLSAPVSQVCFNGVGCHDGASPPSHASEDPPFRIASLVSQLLSLINRQVVLAYQPLSVGGPGSNLKSLFSSKMYRHPIGRDPGTHDPKEAYPMKQAHVECVDCHNSHAAGGRAAMVVGLKSSLRGVTGVSQDTLGTTIATAEYEICYKCHAGPRASYFVGLDKPNRMLAEPDQMKRFSPSNPSFHPVAADRKTAGNSLFPQFRQGMIRIDCSDCHNSDESKKAGGIGPNGPHASRFEHILIARYEMPVKGTSGRSQQCSGYRSDYALCFVCHMDDYVMVSGSSFASGIGNEHAKHVVDRCIPCFACHDPHGTPAQDGATASNNAHLINFDKGYAASLSLPSPRYTATTPGGSCTVACHTVTGGTHSYPVDKAAILKVRTQH
jgi:predicted CXXCH cytochrome family protein